MLESFRPFGYTDAEWDKAKVLVDGAPEALRQPLYAWLIQAMTTDGEWLTEGYGFVIRAKTGIDIGERAKGYVRAGALLKRFSELDDTQLLRLVDFVLATASSQRDYDKPDGLDFILSMSGSKWSTQWDGEMWRLTERVPEGVESAARAAASLGGSAGRLLQRAWVSAFGIQPDAGSAYKLAVKAVETAAHQYVEPKNTGATLGTMLAVIRNQEGWTLPFAERTDHEGSNKEVIVLLMQTLWDGQEDRHRDGVVSIDEARAGVYSAATLVAWFSAGYIART